MSLKIILTRGALKRGGQYQMTRLGNRLLSATMLSMALSGFAAMADDSDDTLVQNTVEERKMEMARKHAQKHNSQLFQARTLSRKKRTKIE